MPLELYMVGVMVEDMARAIRFYRQLGLEFAEGSETKGHVEVKMSGMTFFLTTHRVNAKWDPAKTPASGGYRIILEFDLKSREAVEAKYAEMVGCGYESHVAPFEFNANTYFAMINDPDGNTILLSAMLNCDPT